MEIVLTHDCSRVDWGDVPRILKVAGMAFMTPELHQKAFENSYVTVFLFHGKKLVGCGRAISDGVHQAAVYDVAVLPDYQKQGLGTMIMDEIMARLPHCNLILYASPGKEGFYLKKSFRKMKTGMARFLDPETKAEKGFVH